MDDSLTILSTASQRLIRVLVRKHTEFQAVDPPHNHFPAACVELVIYPKIGFGWASIPQTRYVRVKLNFTLVAQMLPSQGT